MNWNSELYDTKHAFVAQYGENLLTILNPQPGETILDLGCGTGTLTNKIAVAGATVIGVDNSSTMIEKAQGEFPSIDFRVMDGALLQFEVAFDAIFSNAVLHWIPEKEKVAERIFACLKLGGRLVAEFGGKGNVKGMTDAVTHFLQAKGYPVKNFWYFPSVGDYAAVLERAGFRVLLAHHYDRETELADSENGVIDWLEMFGTNFFVGVTPEDKHAVLQQCKTLLKDRYFRNGKLYADYKRLRVVAVKEQ